MAAEGDPKVVTNLNPHEKQMADESMGRELDAQARAICRRSPC